MEWQQYAKGAADAGLALNCYFTAMAIDNFGHDCEAQPDPVLFRGDEGVEDGLLLVGWDAAALVDDADFGLSADDGSTHRNGGAGSGGLRRVADQIQEDLFHQFGVDGNLRE